MRKHFLLKLLAVLLGFTLVASACGDDDSSDGDAAEDTGAADDAADAEDTVEATQDETDLLDAIQARGSLNCGVSTVSIGFAVQDSDGIYQGFDSDFCRATAVAILGDAGAIDIIGLTAAERFTAVQTGQVDLLHRNTTFTQSRDSDVGMDFGPTTYFDGQQLMARVGDGFSSGSGVADIDGAVVCTNAGTTTEKNIAEAADLLGITITLNTFEDFDIVSQNFIEGACDVITTDGSGLVGRKAEQQPADQEWVIFPGQPISKEPLGPTYGQNQSRFADAVNWTVYAMLIADEYGVNQANVDDFVGADGELGRLLGGEGEVQSAMGLAPDAFYQVIKQVGSYSDLWDRHLAPLGLTLPGSVNDLWTNGGLMYPPPAR
ncbi:transporter substrate-binding domain-containing protein [Acidimicrobiales bacterium]|jgi:general L-amino acid transport system substrate-binding protein|nr:transporter substrate-binding domain-containing protein [Acidimicrobiales bacterium]